MKLPKTWPGRQDVDGELLIGILLGPSAHGPGHADLAFPVALEPSRKQQASQATRSHSATATENIKNVRDKFFSHTLALSLSHSLFFFSFLFLLAFLLLSFSLFLFLLHSHTGCYAYKDTEGSYSDPSAALFMYTSSSFKVCLDKISRFSSITLSIAKFIFADRCLNFC